MGPALVGIVIEKPENLEIIKQRMEEYEIKYNLITSSDILYSYLV